MLRETRIRLAVGLAVPAAVGYGGLLAVLLLLGRPAVGAAAEAAVPILLWLAFAGLAGRAMLTWWVPDARSQWLAGVLWAVAGAVAGAEVLSAWPVPGWPLWVVALFAVGLLRARRAYRDGLVQGAGRVKGVTSIAEATELVEACRNRLGDPRLPAAERASVRYNLVQALTERFGMGGGRPGDLGEAAGRPWRPCWTGYRPARRSPSCRWASWTSCG